MLKTFNLLKNQAVLLPRTTFSVVVFCKKTKVTKKGKAPIYARITTTGQSTEVYTQCQIEPERWNQRLERSLYKDEVDRQINRIVASYRASILAAYDRLIQENKTPTCFAVKQLLGSASSSRMVLAEFGKYCEKRQQEVGTRITQLTANKYHRLLRYMIEYIRQMYGKEDLPAGGGPAGEVSRRCQLSGAGQTAARPVEYEDERLPEGDSEYLPDFQASDHAPGAPVRHAGD